MARWKRNPLAAARHQLVGYARGWRIPPIRRMAVNAAQLWVCCTLLLAAGLFVALQMAFKGGAVHRDMMRLVGRRLPPAGAAALALALLLWPLALPSGVLWLALYWSMLLWGYSTRSERVVLAMIWLTAGVVPVLLARAERQLLVELSPPTRAIDQITNGRLSGSLFTELGVMRSQLPESFAARHLLADLHRRLGQWEIARPLYAEVVEGEPQNASAILGLGAYYFRKGDFGKAIELYRQAAALEGARAAAYFNLSLAYSESYLFNESRLALSQARDVDESQVGGWIQQTPPERIVTPDGGFARAEEIRRQLADEARRRSGSRELLRGWLSLPVAAVVALGAVSLHLARRKSGYSPPPPSDGASGGGHWWRWLVPGWSAAARRSGCAGVFAAPGGLGAPPLSPGARRPHPDPVGLRSRRRHGLDRGCGRSHRHSGAARAARLAAAEGLRIMALEGSLEIFSLPEILQMIALQRKTGILTVQGEADIVAVSFLNGDVVAADALNQTLEESLGEALAARGQVRREDVAALTLEQQSGAGRMLDLLVKRGLVERDRLLESLQDQTRKLLISLLRWREGDFKFYGGEEVSYEEGFEPIRVDELLMRAVEEGAIEHQPDLTEVTRFPLTPVPLPPSVAVAPAHTEKPEPAPRAQSEELTPAAPPPPPRPRLVPLASGRRATVAQAPAAASALPAWPGHALAGVLAAALFTVLIGSPRFLALPYPWQAAARDNLERAQRAALYAKIDRAARTFFLLEGRYVDDLERLAEMRLLSRRDLIDPGAHPLAYSTTGLAYTVEPVAAGAPVEGLGAHEAITGDFLLDPEFLQTPARAEAQPLVLLD